MAKKRKKRARPPLDERHMVAIELLANYRTRYTLDEIAEMVTVDRRTLYRWRQRKDFAREYDKAVRKHVERVRRSMPRADWSAVDMDYLRVICDDLAAVNR